MSYQIIGEMQVRSEPDESFGGFDAQISCGDVKRAAILKLLTRLVNVEALADHQQGGDDGCDVKKCGVMKRRHLRPTATQV